MQVTCKIVFDSEEEKKDLINRRCPLAYMGTALYKCPYQTGDFDEEDCPQCWEESGIEMEVKTNDEM